MASINATKKSRTETEKHENWMGGAAYFLSDPVKTLRLAAASCFFGEPMYYHSDDDDKKPAKESPLSVYLPAHKLKNLRETLGGLEPLEWRSMTPAGLLESAIDKALDFDPEATLKLAVELRDTHNIRTTPQVIMVRAAHHPKVRGTGLVRRYAREICSRADEPSVGLAYQLLRYGVTVPVPNGLKKAWALALEAFSEYELAKYRMENRAVKTVDVINLCHAKGPAITKLMRGQLNVSDKTWEAIISAEGSNTASWTKALSVMGHMALLRNLRNLNDHGVPLSAYREKLVAGVLGGKQLPFRYYSAYKALKEKDAAGDILDVVEECMMTSFDTLPFFPGKSMFLTDNSGSAQKATTSNMGSMTVASIGNLTGIVGAQRCEEGWMGVFGDNLKYWQVRKRSSVFDETEKANTVAESIGQGTENGIWLFWREAIKNAHHWDNVFIFSDMQAGHGGLYGVNPGEYKEFAWDSRNIDVGKLINAYRKAVNPRVNVFLIQIAGHQDHILPEFYERTYILGGWSANVLQFAAEMANIVPAQAQAQPPSQ